MKKIIVPIDFSDCSLNAIRYASSLAKLMEAQLLVVYAHTPELEISATPFWLPYAETLPLPKIVHEQMNNVKSLLKDKGVEVHTFIIEGGLDEVVIELAQKKHADLVVMGTDGINFAYTTVWGTHTGHLVEKKKIPVLVVPFNYKGKLEANAEFVFATDFQGIDFIPKFFFELTKKLKAKLNVFTDVEPYRDTINKDNEAIDFTHLEKMFKGSILTMNHTYRENLIHAVEDFASKKQASLIVMIGHKRGFLDNLFHQSVTKQMALHSSIPFLAIPDELVELSGSVSNSGFVG